MTRRNRSGRFHEQMRRSMADLESIMERGESPTGGGRLTVRTIEVVEPSTYDAVSIRRIRRSLRLSQALFAQLLGVSSALVRAWELDSRSPAPVARRLLDQIRARPAEFVGLIRASAQPVRARKSHSPSTRKVA